MGVEKRMDNKCIQITLYTSQTDVVVEKLKQNGYHTAKMKFIKEKYGDVASVFVDAYKWYTSNAQQIVPRDEEAESAIWAYKELKNIEKHSGSQILEISVPIEKAVFFRMSDWNKRLNLRYIGETLKEENEYTEKLAKYGVRYEGDVFNTPFYPQLKGKLIKSWKNLFRYDSKVKETGDLIFQDMQAGIWRLEWDWVQRIL
jgi:uncharacterized protein DUF3841